MLHAASRQGGGNATSNSCDAMMVGTAHPPRHKTKVFVEHATGVFVPGDIHDQVQARQQQSRGGMLGQVESLWNRGDDAADYERIIEAVMAFLERLGVLLGALMCGFSLFLLFLLNADTTLPPSPMIPVITREPASTWTPEPGGTPDPATPEPTPAPDPLSIIQCDIPHFLNYYSTFYFMSQKMFMFACIILILLMLAPVAHEMAQGANKRSLLLRRRDPSGDGAAGEGAGADRNALQNLIFGTSTSPLRHLVSLRFLVYVGCWIATLISQSVEQDRDGIKIRALPSEDETRLRIAIVARSLLFIVGWILSIKDNN